jgi:hypothetical protein
VGDEEHRAPGRRGQQVAEQRAAGSGTEMGRGFVAAELELLHDAGDHADRDVDDQQGAEEPGQPLVLGTAAAMPGRLQQRGQESRPNRDRDEQEVVDRSERELHPGEVGTRHSHRSSVPAAARTSPVPGGADTMILLGRPLPAPVIQHG